MSAKHADSRSLREEVEQRPRRRSRSAPRPCRDRPPSATPCETMNSSAVQPCVRERALDVALDELARQRLAVDDVPAVAVAQRAAADRGPPSIPASAAFCARRMPASSCGDFARRRSSKKRWSTSSSIPFARRWSATPSGNQRGTTARSTPRSRTTRRASSLPERVGVQPLPRELLRLVALHGVDLVLDPDRPDPLDLDS